MQHRAALIALVLICGALGGCQIGGREKGVFEPTAVAPPPSVAEEFGKASNTPTRPARNRKEVQPQPARSKLSVPPGARS
jgi:hypothetical protein